MMNLDAIHKLIEKDLLFVDYRTPSVILSYEIHMAFMDDELKKIRWWYRLIQWMGWMKDDYRYFQLMENLRMYINMMRVSNGMNRITEDKPLVFRVSSIDKKSVLLEGVHVGRRIEFANS